MIKNRNIIFVVAILCLFACGCEGTMGAENSEHRLDTKSQENTQTSMNPNESTTGQENISEDNTAYDGQYYYSDFIIDNSTPLSEGITKEYSLEELMDLFAGRGSDSPNFDGNALKITEVHQKIPIEVLRSGDHIVLPSSEHNSDNVPVCYTVYKVKDGGYYYVFWTTPYVLEQEGTIGQSKEPIVQFSAHLSSELREETFDVLEIGVSTAEDVVKIDAAVEFCTYLSSGIVSCSVLNDEEVVMIRYTEIDRKGNGCWYDNLVVESVSIITRESAPTSFQYVLLKDLPEWARADNPVS